MKFLKRHKGEASAPAEPPKEQYGLFFLHEPPNADIDIVAVHGLGGHFEETWTDNNSKQLWLRDFLPSQLKDIGIAARLLSYGYDSSTAFSKSVTDVEDQATMLLNALALERLSPLENKRPLIFIAHSLGGIVVKKALIIAHERSSQYGPVLSSVQALVFFGVPHRGSDLAYWSTFAARLLKTTQLGLGTNTAFVEALKKNSRAFADISQQFIERATPLKIRTFYETEKLYGNLIVDKDSARLGLPNEIPVGVAAADHRTICKFNDKDSQRYRPVWKAIQALCVKTEEDTASTLTRKRPEPFFIVPFPRDPLFLGREDVIHSLDTKFKSERRVALTGIGGVGKSQIAIEYCYRFRGHHPDSNIFWIHAATKDRFEQAFKAIARQCKLPGWDNSATNPLDLVYDWLSADNTWLMILDNADDKDVFFDQQQTNMSQIPDSQRSRLPLITYLPQTSRKGSMLITSRNRDAAFRLTNNVENLVDVPYMGKEDAVALLCKKLPDDHSSDDERFELVELLEYLPLAITQAASYISVKRTRMTISKYTNFLRKNGDILLDDLGDLRRDPTIPSSVLLTWHISFDQINGENHPAAELLSLMSVFDRQGIPENLLQEKGEDGLQFENRLTPLEEFSLITPEDGGRSFQIHRLIQMAIRSWLEQHGEIDRWKQNAAELIAKSLPDVDYQFWKTWETLLPHSEVALDYVFPNQDSQLLQAMILKRTAWYFKERGKYDAAQERCQRALDIRLVFLEEDNIEVACCLELLASLKRVSGGDGGLEEAEAINRRALDIYERVQGKDNENSMRARNDLALILLDTGHDRKIEEATEILRSLLPSDEQSLGLEDPDTLATMHNLAGAFQNQRKYDEAEKLYRKTLETTLRILGEDHPGTMASMHNLSSNLIQQKRYEEAQGFAQRALDLGTKVLGEEHPGTLRTMGMLAEILSDQRNYEEAEGLHRHELDIQTRIRGADHSDTLLVMANLAHVLHSQGKYKQAEELFRKVYDRPPKGWNDGDWDAFLTDFADTLAQLGKHDEAAEISRRRILSENSSSDLSEISSNLSEMSARENFPRPRSASLPGLHLEFPETRRRMTV